MNAKFSAIVVDDGGPLRPRPRLNPPPPLAFVVGPAPPVPSPPPTVEKPFIVLLDIVLLLLLPIQALNDGAAVVDDEDEEEEEEGVGNVPKFEMGFADVVVVVLASAPEPPLLLAKLKLENGFFAAPRFPPDAPLPLSSPAPPVDVEENLRGRSKRNDDDEWPHSVITEAE